ncbi:polyphenol oxidase family protein [Nigerium massiliense]|uniref:polyphenol oxidase family protein n=1 Tax=Nigerium massiliense TaxID=1522317 RepID=UPI00058D5561|nr:polyphenol oxidase family protein [Nigerium massiliense]
MTRHDTHVDDLGTAGVGVVFTSGSSDLGDAQDRASRDQAYAELAGRLGVRVALVRQVHGRDVTVVTPERVAAGEGPLVALPGVEADGLVTAEPGIALAMRVADCVPVLFADEQAGVVGAAHAGRAGVEKNVVAAVADELARLGATALTAWIGPHICGACYEVPPEMAARFADATGVAPTTTRWGTTGIDLETAVERQLEAVGARVHRHDACTLTDGALHSYRREGRTSGRQAGLIWLRDGRASFMAPGRSR